jgi:hypothetical protein
MGLAVAVGVLMSASSCWGGSCWFCDAIGAFSRLTPVSLRGALDSSRWQEAAHLEQTIDWRGPRQRPFALCGRQLWPAV